MPRGSTMVVRFLILASLGLTSLVITTTSRAADNKRMPLAGQADLGSIKLSLSDLPAGFGDTPASQADNMEDMIRSMASGLAEGDLQNFTAYNTSEVTNLQFVLSGIFAPLTEVEKGLIDSQFTDPQLKTQMADMLGGKDFQEIPGAGSIGNTRMTFSIVSSSMRIDYVSFRRSSVLIEVLVMYRESQEALIGVVDLARLLDERAIAVVGTDSGVAFRPAGPMIPALSTYIPTPLELSTDPKVIGANIFLAALLMLPFAAAAELVTRMLGGGEEALRRKVSPLKALAGFQGWLDKVAGSRLGRPGLLDLIKLGIVMVFYGLTFSLLDRSWNPFSLSGLVLFVSMTLAYGIVGVADDIIQWRVIKRWGLEADLSVRPANILLAILSTATSRLLTLVPGMMFGTPEALRTDEAAFSDRQRRTLLRISVWTFILIGLIVWLPTIFTSLVQRMSPPEVLGNLVGGVEAGLLLIFAVALENTFVQMLGFPGGFGERLKQRSRWLWLGGLVLVSFVFLHTLLNPRGELAAAVKEGNVILLFVVGGIFVLVAFTLWLFIGRRQAQAAHQPSASPVVVPEVALPQAMSATTIKSTPASTPAMQAPIVGKMDSETITGDSKNCTNCGQQIKAEARLCRFCRATFEVKVRGYCFTCHTTTTVVDDKCPRCGGQAADLIIESRMLTAPPRPAAIPSPPAALPEPGQGEEMPAPGVDTKQCPACGQFIQAEARVCCFCKTRLDLPAAAQETILSADLKGALLKKIETYAEARQYLARCGKSFDAAGFESLDAILAKAGLDFGAEKKRAMLTRGTLILPGGGSIGGNESLAEELSQMLAGGFQDVFETLGRLSPTPETARQVQSIIEKYK
jgi:hypothetical protein